MDTKIQPVKHITSRGRYQQRSLELKRQIVEQTLAPGASVSRIAREHGVNANQVFNWRKLHREGLLGRAGKAKAELLPVAVMARSAEAAAIGVKSAKSSSRIWLESTKGCLIIEGQPDASTLRLVLEHLLR